MTEPHPKMTKWNESRRVHLDEEELRRLFGAGLTAAEMAEHFGCSTHPVKKELRRLGLRRPAKRRPGVGVGEDNTQWKGGRRTRKDGYVLVWTSDGERLEHRVVMEAELGRALRDDEVVHHTDGDRANNDPVNLEVMSQSEHVALHAPDMHRARYGDTDAD